MRDDAFATWLSQKHRTRTGTRLGTRPQADARSRCRRVESYEGDLDEHFRRDQMATVIARLTYSRADEGGGLAPRHDIPIDGDVVNGTASLRNAANLYRLFCTDCPP
ncbi:MAG TPA: hypothetical protein VJM12_14025 [Pyrinomonadaceae bacterium]|nr:hypothetical protein [Pyrinomonadaceae bacterium]